MSLQYGPIARRGRRGQALALVTVSLTVIMGVVAFAVDLGLLYYYKTSAQAAADAAALAAATAASKDSLQCGTGITCNVPSDSACPGSAPDYLYYGCLYAAQNGYTTGGHSGRQDVKVRSGINSSPPTVSGMGNVRYWAAVTVSESHPALFSALLGIQQSTVRARATAVVTTVAGNTGTCIYALSPTGTGLRLSGSGTIDANSCSIAVNSTDTDDAIRMNGSGTIQAGVISALGGLDFNGSGRLQASTSILVNGTVHKTGSGTVTPAPAPGATAVQDPFASLSPPSFTNDHCDYSNTHITGSGTTTLNPGIYCGGISISGSGSVIFNSGAQYVINGGIDASGSGNLSFGSATYILNGGGFDASGSMSISGTGVTFYNTGGSSYRGIDLTGSGSLHLSAPLSGSLQGILFFQDRTISNLDGSRVSGSADLELNGSLYFPTTDLDYSGSFSGTPPFTVLVAKTLELSGSGSFKLKPDPTGVQTGLSKTIVTLVE